MCAECKVENVIISNVSYKFSSFFLCYTIEFHSVNDSWFTRVIKDTQPTLN